MNPFVEIIKKEFWGRVLLSVVIVGSFFAVLIGIEHAMLGDHALDKDWKEILMLLLGALIGGFTKVIDFWFKDHQHDQQLLEKISEQLNKKKDLYFTIEGHVCCTSLGRDAVDRGTGKRNLSLARARYIYSYFIKKGIDKKRMKYSGLKHLFPLGGDTKFDKRVEIEITNIKN